MGYQTDDDVLILALDFISEQTGTCPYDMYGFQPDYNCDEMCGKRTCSSCWYEYFKHKVTVERVR